MSYLIKTKTGGYVTSIEMKFDAVSSRKVDTVVNPDHALYFGSRSVAVAILMLLNIKGEVVERKS